MASPLIGSKVLVESPGARQLHQTGLEFEKDGEHDNAHESFAAAVDILTGLPETLDTNVQWARILRDDGFTYVRSAIKNEDEIDLYRARNVLSDACRKTFLEILKAGNTSPGPEIPLLVSKEQKRELNAEHGVTLSLIGRLATVKEIMTGKKDKDDPPARTYGVAHNFLTDGNNGYYRVSNALVAARQERINQNTSGMAVWESQVAIGLAWTALRDPGNLIRSIETIGNRELDLRSYSAAKKSVITKP